MNDGSGRPGSRFTLRWWHLVLAALVVLAAAIGIHVALRHNELQRRLEALRAEGYPTNVAELAEYTQLPAGVQNAASVYVDAFALYMPPADDAKVPFLGKAKLPQRAEPLPEPMARAMADCLTANEQCLALLHEAAGFEQCRYNSDYKDYATRGPDFASIKRCAQLLNLGVVLHANEGDNEAAVQDIHDGLRLANSLRREPALISYLVRVACNALTVSGLEQALNRTTFTDEQLKELDEAFTAVAADLDLAEVIITERCFNLEGVRDPLQTGGSGPGGIVLRLPGIQGRGLLDILDYTDDCVEAARLPLTERVARFRDIDKELEELSALHLMIKLLAPRMRRFAELDLRVRAHLDLAKTALAAERYRLAVGNVPSELAELVPTYLDEVPIDPFDARAIRYERADDGYVLYSIAEDGVDNGGIEKEQAGRGQHYDLCFIVTR